MNILFCGDSNIADGVIISVLSLMKNTKEKLNIFLLTANVHTEKKSYKALEPAFAEVLEEIIKRKHQDCSVSLFDITELFAAQTPLANMQTRFTPCCMLRLYADKVAALPERILYLDNDIICGADPAEFYNADMNGAPIAGVLDYYGSHFFRKKLFKRDYLNSGVLLLDLKKIRETGLFERCLERCREKEMFMPDQSAINKLSEKKLILPRRYNEQRRLHKNTVFRHFTTSFRLFPYFHTVSVKPWNIDRMHNTLKLHCYDDILQEYLEIKNTYFKEN